MAWWKEFQDLSIKHCIKLILHENDVKLSKFKRSLVKIKRRKFKIYVDLWYVWRATFWLLIREKNTSTKTMEWLNSFSIVNLSYRKSHVKVFCSSLNLYDFLTCSQTFCHRLSAEKSSFVIRNISLLPNSSSNHTQLTSQWNSTIETVEKGVKYVQS